MKYQDCDGIIHWRRFEEIIKHATSYGVWDRDIFNIYKHVWSNIFFGCGGFVNPDGTVRFPGHLYLESWMEKYGRQVEPSLNKILQFFDENEDLVIDAEIRYLSDQEERVEGGFRFVCNRKEHIEVGDQSFAIGDSVTAGANSLAIGKQNIRTGKEGISIGYDRVASGKRGIISCIAKWRNERVYGFVDGEKIKENVFYSALNMEFVESDLLKETIAKEEEKHRANEERALEGVESLDGLPLNFGASLFGEDR